MHTDCHKVVGRMLALNWTWKGVLVVLFLSPMDTVQFTPTIGYLL
jgi:hypothetical protein